MFYVQTIDTVIVRSYYNVAITFLMSIYLRQLQEGICVPGEYLNNAPKLLWICWYALGQIRQWIYNEIWRTSWHNGVHERLRDSFISLGILHRPPLLATVLQTASSHLGSQFFLSQVTTGQPFALWCGPPISLWSCKIWLQVLSSTARSTCRFCLCIWSGDLCSYLTDPSVDLIRRRAHHFGPKEPPHLSLTIQMLKRNSEKLV